MASSECIIKICFTASCKRHVAHIAKSCTYYSWELGTRSQALLELHANIFSVLSHQPLPPRSTIPANLSDQMSTILGIAKSVVSNRTSIQGPQPLMQDGSAGDPASIGIVVAYLPTGQDKQLQIILTMLVPQPTSLIICWKMFRGRLTVPYLTGLNKFSSGRSSGTFLVLLLIVKVM